MTTPAEDASQVWFVREVKVLSGQGPAASLISVAYAKSEFFVLARGEIERVESRPFDPEFDIPSSRLKVSVEANGQQMRQTSATSTADRDSWVVLQQWAGVEPDTGIGSISDLSVLLELDGKICQYTLARLDA